MDTVSAHWAMTFHALSMASGFLLAALAAGYSLLAVAALGLHRRWRGAAQEISGLPAVTLLKPLCGDEFELYEQLRSFCLQDYPRLQIVFGISDATDPALHAVHRLQQEFPTLDLHLAIDPVLHGTNRKVGNLINMVSRARYDYLVISDSDIRVPRNYAATAVQPLLDPAVGIVTCLYRARPRPGLWSALGALFIDEWFMPSVRVAALLGSQSFASGATIALRRDALSGIGGFAVLADQLADDFKLGEQVRSRGLRTVLSEVMVETTVDEPTLGALVRHQLRWLRTIRSIQPLGYACSVITFSVPTAMLGAALMGGTAPALLLLAIAAACRLTLHFVRPTHGLRSAVSQLWMLPLHDVLAFGLWCWSFAAPEITWRQGRYRVERDGSLRRMA